MIRGDWAARPRRGRALALPAPRRTGESAEVGHEPEVVARPSSLWRDVAVFSLVGGVTTLAYIALYVALRPALAAPTANAIAFVATAVVNTMGHRHFTFRLRRWEHGVRQQLENGALLGVGVLITSGALVGLDAVVADPTAPAEAFVLAGANLVAAVLHFVALRNWVFRPDRA